MSCLLQAFDGNGLSGVCYPASSEVLWGHSRWVEALHNQTGLSLLFHNSTAVYR